MKPIYLKIISLFFALSITAYSLFAFRGNYNIRYSIVVENIPQNVILKQENLDVVLEIDCPQILYSVLQENKNKTISIKFEKNFLPAYSINLQELLSKNFIAPPLCKLVNVSPKFITLEFEKIVQRSVRVVPDIVGNVPDGYIVSVSVYPQYVNISGPEDELKGRDRIFTDMIDIQGRTSDFSIEVPIYKTGNIKVYPQTATVFVSIKKVN
jgi:hypothetical protein